MSQPANDQLAFLTNARSPLRRRRRWRMHFVRRSIHLAETGAILIAGTIVADALPPAFGTIPVLWGVVAASVAALLMLEFGNRDRAGAMMWQLVAAALAGGVALALLGVPWRTDLNWIAGELVLAGFVLAILRAISGALLAAMLARGSFATRVGVVGAGPAGLRTTQRLRATDSQFVRVVGTYRSGVESVAGQPELRGNVRTLLSDCRADLVDAVIVALEPGDTHELEQLRAALRPCVQDVYFTADLIAHSPEDTPVFALGTTPLLRVSERPLQGWGGRCKRAIDLVGASLLLAVMLPALTLIALAIRLETPGPILFRQLRVGYNNQLFYILKFRSMHADQSDALAKQQTVRGDARITRVGQVIRRLSLDELPQLLNVVLGDMSLVGPRPHAPGTSIGGRRIHTVIDTYACRHLVRPGITGLAQMRGQRGGLTTEGQVAARLASDLEYIRTWSLWLDVRIVLATVLVELRGSNAC